jgi:hypothetical protein
MSLKEAIATHLGWDIADVEWYQPFNWTKKIVATDENWYCATRTATPPRVASTRDDAVVNGWTIAETFGNIRVWKK